MWWHQEQLAGPASAEGSEEEGICCWVWGSLAPVAPYAPRHFPFLGWDVLDLHPGGALGRRGWEEPPPLYREVAARGLDALPPPLPPSPCVQLLSTPCVHLLILASSSWLCSVGRKPPPSLSLDRHTQACSYNHHKYCSCTSLWTQNSLLHTENNSMHKSIFRKHTLTHTYKHNPHCCESTNEKAHTK